MDKKPNYYRGRLLRKSPFRKICVWSNIKWYITEIKAAFDRAINGYDYFGRWNLNDWFLDTVPHILNDMIVGHYGHPQEVNSSEEWEEILKRMKFCFEEAAEDTCSLKNEFQEPYFDTLDSVETKLPNGHYSVHITCDEDLKEKYWKREEELYKYRETMRKEGLELFDKWFPSLWD